MFNLTTCFYLKKEMHRSKMKIMLIFNILITLKLLTNVKCLSIQEIYPGQFQPSLCHKFISMLDKQGKLLRNYTQNIDTLEQVAGVQRIIQCHGEC